MTSSIDLISVNIDITFDASLETAGSSSGIKRRRLAIDDKVHLAINRGNESTRKLLTTRELPSAVDDYHSLLASI